MEWIKRAGLFRIFWLGIQSKSSSISSPLSLCAREWMAWNSTLSVSDSPTGGCGALVNGSSSTSAMSGEKRFAQCAGVSIDVGVIPLPTTRKRLRCGATLAVPLSRVVAAPNDAATVGNASLQLSSSHPDNQFRWAWMGRFTHTNTSQPVKDVTQRIHGTGGRALFKADSASLINVDINVLGSLGTGTSSGLTNCVHSMFARSADGALRVLAFF